jgi:hypothetical protein
MTASRVGLDSNCLSYLIDAATRASAGSTPVSVEGTALLRILFYVPGRFFVTDTVAEECRDIRNPEKLAIHTSFTSYTYWGIPINDLVKVSERAKSLSPLHSGDADCLVLAEAEDAELDVLLTYDRNFLKLGAASGTVVKLSRPSEHWASLSIPRSSPLVNRPTQGNPLEGQSWWLWE